VECSSGSTGQFSFWEDLAMKRRAVKRKAKRKAVRKALHRKGFLPGFNDYSHVFDGAKVQLRKEPHGLGVSADIRAVEHNTRAGITLYYVGTVPEMIDWLSRNGEKLRRCVRYEEGLEVRQ